MIVDLAVNQPWRREAVCAQTDPEVFFPEKGGRSTAAKRICNGGNGVAECPVRDKCLEWALEHDERFGVWGGKCERERRALKPGRAERTPIPPPGHGTEKRAHWDRRHGVTPCGGCLEAERAANRRRTAERDKTVIPPGAKQCGRCHDVKPGDQFNRSGGRADGLHHNCRECSKAEYREWYDRVGRNRRGDRIGGKYSIGVA